MRFKILYNETYKIHAQIEYIQNKVGSKRPFVLKVEKYTKQYNL